MIINVGKIGVGGKFLTAVAVFMKTVAAPDAIDSSADDGPVSLQAAAAKHGNGGGNAGLEPFPTIWNRHVRAILYGRKGL